MELNQFFFHVGMLIIRCGIGIPFIKSGFLKLTEGKKKLLWLGHTMQNLGITQYPLFWGTCAMLSELIGGSCILVGLYTRFFSLMLSFTMFVGVMYHIKQKDEWEVILYPLSYLLMCLGLFFAGPGAYRITALF